jgi:hypothetical protein
MPTSRRIRAAVASVVLLAFFAITSHAQDAPAPAAAKSEATKAGTYRSVLADFQAAEQAFEAAYSAAKTDPERQKAVDEKYPDREKFAARMVAAAEARPDDPEAVDAAVWAASYTYNGTAHEAALRMLSGPYVRSEKIAAAVNRLPYSQSAAAPEALKKIADQNPSREVKAAATYSLGSYYKEREQNADAEKAFEAVIAGYGDVTTGRGSFGEASKAQLHEIRDLAVGKVAPEIEGVDVDGKTFKLSQYRGKVVVLDFWGDW